jgi:hypothetical protein
METKMERTVTMLTGKRRVCQERGNDAEYRE